MSGLLDLLLEYVIVRIYCAILNHLEQFRGAVVFSLSFFVAMPPVRVNTVLLPILLLRF